jgi:hypothetical protein
VVLPVGGAVECMENGGFLVRKKSDGFVGTGAEQGTWAKARLAWRTWGGSWRCSIPRPRRQASSQRRLAQASDVR